MYTEVLFLIARRKMVDPNDPIPVLLTRAEVALIRDETLYDEPESLIGVAEGSRVRLQLSPYDLEHLHGYVAAAANHTADRKLQSKLDRILEKLNRLLEALDWD